MQDLILIGSGGCMRELLWQIQELNKEMPTWNVLGYVDKRTEGEKKPKDVLVGNRTYPYLGDDEFLLAKTEATNVMMCVGEPHLRQKIADKLLLNPNIKFPNILLKNTEICEDIVMGQGCVFSMDSRVSTNVRIDDFVFLNTGAKICHDGQVSSFTTLGPDATLAGNVIIGRGCSIGLGAKVIQGLTLGENVTVGAGAVVVRDIPPGITVAGIPAKPL